MTMQNAYQVMITLQLRVPNGHSNFYSTVRGTLRDTHRIHVYYVNGRVCTGHEIVGELFHDHEIVRNVTYESLWDNLGMSDVKWNIYLKTGINCNPCALHFPLNFVFSLSHPLLLSIVLICSYSPMSFINTWKSSSKYTWAGVYGKCML